MVTFLFRAALFTVFSFCVGFFIYSWQINAAGSGCIFSSIGDGYSGRQAISTIPPVIRQQNKIG